MHGQAFFRSVVIEALGDSSRAYALQGDHEVAKLDGPLQDDAVLALGKIGDKRRSRRWPALQRTAPRESQPAIAAAICLLGVNCGRTSRTSSTRCVRHREYRVPGTAARRRRRRWRRSPSSGREDAAAALISQRRVRRAIPVRAPIALGLGTVALRNTRVAAQGARARADPRAGSSCCAKPSTCSKRISKRSDSSRPSAAPTGGAAGSPAARSPTP